MAIIHIYTFINYCSFKTQRRNSYTKCYNFAWYQIHVFLRKRDIQMFRDIHIQFPFMLSFVSIYMITLCNVTVVSSNARQRTTHDSRLTAVSHHLMGTRKAPPWRSLTGDSTPAIDEEVVYFVDLYWFFSARVTRF